MSENREMCALLKKARKSNLNGITMGIEKISLVGGALGISTLIPNITAQGIGLNISKKLATGGTMQIATNSFMLAVNSIAQKMYECDKLDAAINDLNYDLNFDDKVIKK